MSRRGVPSAPRPILGCARCPRHASRSPPRRTRRSPPCERRWAARTRSRRCWCGAGWPIPRPPARGWRADERHDLADVRRHGRGGRRPILRPRRRRARGSSSTATTTSTASARRRSWSRVLRELGADVRLVPAEPHRGRLRPQPRDGRAAGRRGLPAARHRRLRHHRGRRGRRGAGGRDGRGRHRPPHAASRRRAARRADRPSARSAATRAPSSARPASPTCSRARCSPAAGRDPGDADADLDLVALATVADCVPLVGENRRLVREGLRALAGTQRRRPARADGRGALRSGRGRRAVVRVPPRAADQRRRPAAAAPTPGSS